jgi:hypothetical protein
MHDALLVRGFQRVRDLASDGQRFGDRHGPARNPIRERRSFDQFQNERRDASASSKP